MPESFLSRYERARSRSRELFDLLTDQAMLDRWSSLDALPDEERERILSVLDSLLRDAKARQAYAQTG